MKPDLRVNVQTVKLLGCLVQQAQSILFYFQLETAVCFACLQSKTLIFMRCI